MTDNSNAKKSEQLGMSSGAAVHQLRKRVLFRLLQRYGEDVCFQCGEKIENVDDLSMEHKIPWLDNSVELFWDLDNIAFSHLICNIKAARQTKIAAHGTRQGYRRGCRCGLCKAAHNEYHKTRRARKSTAGMLNG